MGSSQTKSHHYLSQPPGSVVIKHRERVPVYLNVYDLAVGSPLERLARIGFGLYHSGIQVRNCEYGFGGGMDLDDSVTGVFAIPPCTFAPNVKQTLLLGYTECSVVQIEWFLEGLRREWPANSYHILNRNCNHFSETLAKKIGINKFPGWVNRAARTAGWLLPSAVTGALIDGISQQVPPNLEENDSFGGPGCWADAVASGDCVDDQEESLQVPEDLENLTVRQLKTLMWLHRLDWSGCVEKEDLIAKLKASTLSPE
eukprot:NODE_2920_length_1089_cov_16.760577_g2679_i0.p1 GENE.NODE_2920_length_1089_cov_16.760577_g2679_i0~~NODE_2920_length_1089_cov_16.760577_g2679_i0.p1  ORF type:complete len:257 (-),score=40.42 NODE_2920_length_1089_cov_16.760577_g2679_i0:73-843(-)